MEYKGSICPGDVGVYLELIDANGNVNRRERFGTVLDGFGDYMTLQEISEGSPIKPNKERDHKAFTLEASVPYGLVEQKKGVTGAGASATRFCVACDPADAMVAYGNLFEVMSNWLHQKYADSRVCDVFKEDFDMLAHRMNPKIVYPALSQIKSEAPMTSVRISATEKMHGGFSLLAPIRWQVNNDLREQGFEDIAERFMCDTEAVWLPLELYQIAARYVKLSFV